MNAFRCPVRPCIISVLQSGRTLQRKFVGHQFAATWSKGCPGPARGWPRTAVELRPKAAEHVTPAERAIATTHAAMEPRRSWPPTPSRRVSKLMSRGDGVTGQLAKFPVYEPWRLLAWLACVDATKSSTTDLEPECRRSGLAGGVPCMARQAALVRLDQDHLVRRNHRGSDRCGGWSGCVGVPSCLAVIYR